MPSNKQQTFERLNLAGHRRSDVIDVHGNHPDEELRYQLDLALIFAVLALADAVVEASKQRSR